MAALGARMNTADGVLGLLSDSDALPPTESQIQEAWTAVRDKFEQHAITQRLDSQVLAAWHAWATDRVHVFQSAS